MTSYLQKGKTQAMAWRGMPAMKLENEVLQIVIVPEMGAKIVSLFDKRYQVEWLISPQDRAFKLVSYGATFTDQDMSGWDEMFPTISACDYPGPGLQERMQLPDHGEVWTLPWTPVDKDETKLSYRVVSPILPYQLTRQIEYFEDDAIQLIYHLSNLSNHAMPFMWAAHPQFTCGQDARIVLPKEITKVINVLPESFGWGQPGTVHDWPRAINKRGEIVELDLVAQPNCKKARKYYVLPEAQVSWFGLIRASSSHWITLEWDPKEIPYFGLWIDEGYFGTESVVTPEPITGFYDDLSLAWQKKSVRILPPGETVAWNIIFRCGGKGEQFPFS